MKSISGTPDEDPMAKKDPGSHVSAQRSPGCYSRGHRDGQIKGRYISNVTPIFSVLEDPGSNST